MDKAEFEKYLKERYQDQIDWYDKKSQWNQKRYRNLQWIMIIFSSITPVLVALDYLTTSFEHITVIPIITSIIVAIVASALRSFKYYDTWVNYRTICETLKKEIHLYTAAIGDYKDANDKESLFVERVESIISRENTLWLTTTRRDEKEEKTH